MAETLQPQPSNRKLLLEGFKKAGKQLKREWKGQAGEKVRAFVSNPQVQIQAARIAGEIAAESPRLRDIVMELRRQRQEAQNGNSTHAGSNYQEIRRVTAGLPVAIGDYTISDAINLTEGITGKKLGGKNLDTLSRGVAVVAALVPGISSTDLIERVTMVRDAFEGAVARKQVTPPSPTSDADPR